jgi:serine/threonine protein phosphatase PrpC
MEIYLDAPITKKVFAEAGNKEFVATSVEMQGWRKEMEDACFIHPSKTEDFPSLLAVFDGHAGLEVSNLAKITFTRLF